jgi:hypothetical protein
MSVSPVTNNVSLEYLRIKSNIRGIIVSGKEELKQRRVESTRTRFIRIPVIYLHFQNKFFSSGEHVFSEDRFRKRIKGGYQCSSNYKKYKNIIAFTDKEKTNL